jgi:serine/threonine protein phosphatase PrpC
MPDMTVDTLPSNAPIIGRIFSPRAFDGLPSADLNRLPAVRCEAGWLSQAWLQAASLAGRSHRKNGSATSGQDVYGYTKAEDASDRVITVLAVADGLGSKEYSHVGATLAIRVACKEVVEAGYDFWLDPTDAEIRQVALAINAKLMKGVLGRESHVATTLAVLVLLPHATPLVRGFRIGDPEGFVLSADRQLVPLWPTTEGQSGAINQVASCLPARDDDDVTAEPARYELKDADLGLVLLSDGVSNDVIASSQVRNWCTSRWSTPLDALAMADTLRYQRQGSTDDRTALVLLIRPSSQAFDDPAQAALPDHPEVSCGEPGEQGVEPTVDAARETPAPQPHSPEADQPDIAEQPAQPTASSVSSSVGGEDDGQS